MIKKPSTARKDRALPDVPLVAKITTHITGFAGKFWRQAA
jgi:hypothetical protein